MTEQKSPLYIFVDESGNFDFTNKGTNHFVLGAFATYDPIQSATNLLKLKYALLREGYDITQFHAAEDKQIIRDLVFKSIDSIPLSMSHVIYGNKHLLAPNLQTDQGIYSLFGRAMIRFYRNGLNIDRTSSIIIIFDQALPAKKRGYLAGILKPELKELGIPFRIYFHKMSTDFNGQIADYISWAKYVELERSETRPWNFLQASSRPTDFDIFRRSTRSYY
jgi:hypothetical protein